MVKQKIRLGASHAVIFRPGRVGSYILVAKGTIGGQIGAGGTSAVRQQIVPIGADGALVGRGADSAPRNGVAAVIAQHFVADGHQVHLVVA